MSNAAPRVIAFVNIAHFIDHYAMLVFAAAVVMMAPAFDLPYGALLPYATPGFIAFGAGSLLAGWLGDRWSRHKLMAIFFFGIGGSLCLVGLARSPLEVGAALFAVGAFAAIYHPVGSALLVAHAERLGRQMGTNGVWGNLGVAASALVTGAVMAAYGWRWAFVVPGLATLALGVAFLALVPDSKGATKKQGSATVTLAPSDRRRVILSLLLTVIASSTTFNAVTVALPKLFAERLHELILNPAWLGLVTAGVYLFGAVTQIIVGRAVDRFALKWVFLTLALLPAPLLALAAGEVNLGLVLASIGIIIGLFGQVTVNDAMVGRYTADAVRARAYAIRYFVGFTAAGLSVGLVGHLHETGGFTLVFTALAGLCCLTILGAFIFPRAPLSSAP
jgi:MFS family permease